MSISVTMFVKLLNFEFFVCLSKHFFCYFCSITYLQKQKSEFFFNLKGCKNFSEVEIWKQPPQWATIFYNFGIVAISLANSWKPLKFHCFESIENLVFLDLEFVFFLFALIFFVAVKAGIVINLFLNLEQVWASCSYKIVFIKKRVYCIIIRAVRHYNCECFYREANKDFVDVLLILVLIFDRILQ